MNYPSKLIEDAVLQISALPGIGKKSALRIALHLLKSEPHQAVELADALKNLRLNTVYCTQCHNISDAETCEICKNPGRNHNEICVVEDTKNVLAIENTGQYRGVYHVLNGLISPIEGVAPSDLNIESLIERLSHRTETTEVILALSPNMKGDTTAFYVQKKLKVFAHANITTIARGIPIGGDLEYVDELTLARGFSSRVPYE